MFSTTSQPQFRHQAVDLLVAFNIPKSTAEVLIETTRRTGLVSHGENIVLRTIDVEQPANPLADPKPDFLVCFTDDVAKVWDLWNRASNYGVPRTVESDTDTTHTPNVIKGWAGPTNAELLFFAECSCGWSDIVDSRTRQDALDRHTNLHASKGA
jgi:hypothetical protein